MSAQPETARRLEAAINQLLGLARGVLADGSVSGAEVVAIAHWLSSQGDMAEAWPVNVLARRLQRLLEDGRADADERADLAELLERLAAGGHALAEAGAAARGVPLALPVPEVLFYGRVFVLAGSFAYGSRAECEKVITQLGGECERELDADADYLVVGTFVAEDWERGEVGRQVRRAGELAAEGRPVAIIAEKDWVAALP